MRDLLETTLLIAVGLLCGVILLSAASMPEFLTQWISGFSANLFASFFGVLYGAKLALDADRRKQKEEADERRDEEYERRAIAVNEVISNLSKLYDRFYVIQRDYVTPHRHSADAWHQLPPLYLLASDVPHFEFRNLHFLPQSEEEHDILEKLSWCEGYAKTFCLRSEARATMVEEYQQLVAKHLRSPNPERPRPSPRELAFAVDSGIRFKRSRW